MSAGDDAREDACRDYLSSLEDLTYNSKPHINMLTILAEENVQFAKDIGVLIEAQIAKAAAAEKLPVLYLMDSIVKNVGRDYLAAFAKNLVTTFVCVFEKVDENTRKSLFKLRSTWDELFPSKKLYALDVRVNQIDPAWPIKPLPPNVNTSSIHVNPKFLNKPEETPPAKVPSAVPPRANPEVQKQLSQEQLIRQQLLVKQKQLLELQQKKLELELEQTREQLALSSSKPVVTPKIPHMPVKAPQPVSQNFEKIKIPPFSQPIEKPHEKMPAPSRDPRLVKENQHSAHMKDLGHKKEAKTNITNMPDLKPIKPLLNDKANASAKPEKSKSNEKLPKRESVQSELKDRSKSQSPFKAKLPHVREKSQGVENVKELEVNRRDPRLHKHLRTKSDNKDSEPKEKRKCDKKEDHKSEHRAATNRNKPVGGIVQKNEPVANYPEKLKPGRISNRKRSRSPKSRSPAHSPKGRDRRSPKVRPRSTSPVHSLPKIGRLRPPVSKPSHTEDFNSSSREERMKRTAKTDVRDNRRQKRLSEERPQDPVSSMSTKSNTEPKPDLENWQGPQANKRWKSGWEDNKNSQNKDHHQSIRPPYQRHNSWQNSSKEVASPRTPKQQHWLSVDADLKIPKELTSASKAELLKKANERFSLGEITHDELLVVVHQIRQLFQYQEEKQRCSVWDSPTEENKDGEYVDPEYLDLELEEMVHSGRDTEHGGRTEGGVPERNEPFPERQRHSPLPVTRPHPDDAHDGYRRHKDQLELPKGSREEQRSVFTERFPHSVPMYDESEAVPYGESADSRMSGNNSNQKNTLMEERRPLLDIPPHIPVNRGDAPIMKVFEEPSSVANVRESSPVNACMPFDGASVNQVGSQRFDVVPGQPVDSHFDGMGANQVENTRFDGMNRQGQQGMQKYEGVQNQAIVSSQPMAMQRLEGPTGQPMNAARFEGPPGQQLGALRFEGAPGQPMGPQRFEGMQPLGPQRFDGVVGPQGPQRFDGSPRPPLMQQRFEGGPCQPMRFEQPMRQPVRFEGLVGPRFEVNPPQRFDSGPRPQPLMRFDGPMGQIRPRFDGTPVNRFDSKPPHIQRFDLPGQPCQRFEGPPGHQTPPRFDGPMQVQPRFDGPMPQRFDGPNQQPRFDLQMSQGPRFDNIHPPIRQNAPPFGQTGPYGDPQNHFHGQPQSMQPQGMPLQGMQTQGMLPQGMPPQGMQPQGMPHQGIVPQGMQPQGMPPQGMQAQGMPPQGMQQQGMPLQRPEQRFDLPQGPNFAGPSGPGVQSFPNQLPRPSGPYFDDNNPNSQGPQFSNFNNLPVGNLTASQQFGPLGGMSQPAGISQPPGMSQPAFSSLDQNYVPPQGPAGGVFVQPGGSFPFPENHLGQLDVNELFSKLLSTGILMKVTPKESSTQCTEEVAESSAPAAVEEEEEDADEDQDVPDLTSFNMEDLKHRYDSVINRIYTGIQCYSCGMRFTKSQTDIYADHLDWHYRQNRTEKDVSRKITHRRWYYSLKDWIEFEEIADLEERAKSQFFEKVHEEVILKTQEAAKEKEFQSVQAGPAGADEICEICQEQFEQYWDEEEEEWHLKNAMRVNEKIYHPSCYDDYKNTSSFLDNTPSPSKTLLENPLNAMLSLVKEEVTEPSCSVKVEPADNEAPSSCEIPLLTDIKKEPDESE
ncbi:pre-mRNA cleavage complex 2 protein Pcf11 isoform X2 [Xenopus laevis]|uniref:Pre-mRNA cleavage complex 2 protein Pcf11 n=1 Tax=Xenopus laevis TaxID=8355 RepID=A0A8J0UL43_XENLA|nr:pre-mRNA cleavage complex 2 protein Pcf11 isoform X2 [Xenopus laevis]